MSLQATVAVPFRQAGRDRLGQGEFVVALSLERDWFSPDQAKRVVDVALGQGLLDRDDGSLVPRFDPDEVAVPADFVPDETVLREQSAFERVLEALVASGMEKQAAVAAINETQRDLAVSVEAAAVLVARREDVEIGEAAARARAKLVEGE